MARVTSSKVGLLRKVPLLAGLGRSDLEAVATLADEIDVPAGHVLFREGDIGHEFFIVVTGEVRVQRQGRTLEVERAGDFFAEMALILHKPRAATATCETDCRLLVLPNREFNSLLARSPAIQLKVLTSLAERFAQLELERHG